MTSLGDWIRSTLPLQPAVLDHAVEQAQREALAARVSEDAWCERLQRDPVEVQRLLEIVVPPETWLFRHGAAFECVREHLRSVGSRPVRILSLACAGGAEAFSLASTALDAGRTSRTCEIVAVDWNPENLRRAATGTCAPLAQRGPLPSWATRHFVADKTGWIRLVPEGLQMIRWMQADITREGLPLDCDVVFCRNVAIYLDESARLRLAGNLAACTRPDGLLCIGHADPARIWSGAFRPLPVSGAFAYQRAGVAPDAPARTAVPVRLTSPAVAALPASASPALPSVVQAQELADAGALERAIEMLQRILQANPVDAVAWHLLGSARLAQGSRSEAESCFRKVVYLEPEHAVALLQLSMFAEERGDLAAAERMRARAMRGMRGEAE